MSGTSRVIFLHLSTGGSDADAGGAQDGIEVESTVWDGEFMLEVVIRLVCMGVKG